MYFSSSSFKFALPKKVIPLKRELRDKTAYIQEFIWRSLMTQMFSSKFGSILLHVSFLIIRFFFYFSFFLKVNYLQKCLNIEQWEAIGRIQINWKKYIIEKWNDKGRDKCTGVREGIVIGGVDDFEGGFCRRDWERWEGNGPRVLSLRAISQHSLCFRKLFLCIAEPTRSLSPFPFPFILTN